MFKRIIALCLALLTISTLFCGCVNITVVEKDDSNQKTEASTAPSVAEETSAPTIPPVTEEAEKQYTSSAKIIITSGSSSDISSDQLNSAKNLIDTYAIILKDRTIQAPVQAMFPDVEYTCDLKAVGDTGICQIVVTGEEKEHLQAICDKLADEFCAKVPAIVGACSVKRLDKASLPT